MKTVLIAAHVQPSFANTVHDHLNALRDHEAFSSLVFDPVIDRDVVPDLADFDLLILHYSLICFSENYIAPGFRDAIRRWNGLKAIFIQDEYRHINAANDAMIDLGIDVLFTCVPAAMIPRIYGRLAARGVRIEPTLTGYVPQQLVGLPRRPIRDRELDIVYRGRALPPTLGRLSMEKVAIAREVARLAPAFGLKVDVDWREDARIYGEAWNAFLASGRAALGTESGASICDFDGTLDAQWLHHAADDAPMTPEAYHDRFLTELEGNGVIATISPRAFEAIALGTPMIQFPGAYSGILERDVHYIALDKDLSNFGEVREKLRDTDFLQAMADRTYESVIASGDHSYRRFADDAFRVMDEEFERRCAVFDNRGRRIAGDGGVRALPRDMFAQHADGRIELARGLADFAKANRGTVVASNVGFFGRPHDLDYLTRDGTDEGYAAAVDGDGDPQWVEFRFANRVSLHRVAVTFFTSDLAPRRVTLEATLPDGQTMRLADLAEPGAAIELAPSPVSIVSLRLTATAFGGQERLLIRRFELWGKNDGALPPAAPAKRSLPRRLAGAAVRRLRGTIRRFR